MTRQPPGDAPNEPSRTSEDKPDERQGPADTASRRDSKALSERLRAIPAIGEIIERLDSLPKWAVRDAAREIIGEIRADILAGKDNALGRGDIEDAVSRRAALYAAPRLGPVINATGVILHTNLGRAPLSRRAVERIQATASDYSNLEYDLDRGARGSRHDLVEPLLRRLSGAESALVVNNNAAAILLALTALADGGEVIISRGELIEIGDGFRIPDILAQSGATLVEVGTTNRTSVDDYRRAITERTSCLLKVHPSNFRVVGFTGAVDRRELTALGHSRGLLVLEDLGSGAFRDLGDYSLTDEPSVQFCLRAGVDLVMMSGDKLLGGPQAGILLGKRACIERCKRHPLARALRIDKLGLAALEGTLLAYQENIEAPDVPILAMIRTSMETLRHRADAIRTGLTPATRRELKLEVIESRARVGGGAYPAAEIKSMALSIGGPRARALERFLRTRSTPIIARLHDGRVHLDLRTIADRHIGTIIDALETFATSGSAEERSRSEKRGG